MAKKVIAFDIGGTSIRVAIVQGNKLSKFESVPTPQKKKRFFQELEQMIKDRLDDSIKGIGIAFPGQIENGRVTKAPNLPIHDFNLKSYLQRKFKTKVEIHNDASCVALAEQAFGCKKKDFIVLTLGTGIGGGMVINGKEYTSTGLGAEFGHIVIREQFLETLWQNTRKTIKETFKVDLISDLVEIKAFGKKEILEDIADYMGQAIASLINALDPEVVILAGGVKECKSKFLNPLKRGIKKYTFLTKTTPIQWTGLSEPGVLGASLLV